MISSSAFWDLSDVQENNLGSTTEPVACISVLAARARPPNEGLLEFPDATLAAAGRNCRNPDRKYGGPWCYVGPRAWAYCDIPFCPGSCRPLSLLWKSTFKICTKCVSKICQKSTCSRNIPPDKAGRCMFHRRPTRN